MTSIGQTVRRWRDERGWDQKDVADRAGLPRDYISQVERNVAGDPGVKKLLKIANAFGRPLTQLLQESGLVLTVEDEQRLQEGIGALLQGLPRETQEEIFDFALFVRERAQRQEVVQISPQGSTNGGSLSGMILTELLRMWRQIPAEPRDGYWERTEREEDSREQDEDATPEQPQDRTHENLSE